MANKILEDLNPEQKQAVLHFNSPLLIVAGAGSGKTKVITHKIAYLIQEKKYSPINILGVTFTNKASEEMKKRVENLTNIDVKHFNISTFHSLGLKILRESGKTIGFDREWQVIDENDQKKIITRIITEKYQQLSNDITDHIQNKINMAKMNLFYPNNPEFLSQRGFDETEIKIFSDYFNFQKQNKIWDYEDLVSFPVKLLENHESIRSKYTQKFQYVVIDEFQDTNPNQYELIKLLAEEKDNITVVGDDDQAIYSWRGASMRFLLDFEKDFMNTKIIKLEQNYRSSQQTLEFANVLIMKNSIRKQKSMWTEKGSGHPVFILNTHSKDHEANSITNLILKLRSLDQSLLPVAILYRTNSQSLAFETEFIKNKIDFKIIKGQTFFERKEIKDCLALFRLSMNLNDDVSFLRITEFLPLGIGPRTLDLLFSTAQENKISLFSSLREYYPEKFKNNDVFPGLLKIHQEKDQYSYSQILTKLLALSNYYQKLAINREDNRILNIDELITLMKKWEQTNSDKSLNELFDQLSLNPQISYKNEKSDAYLLTMHNAKGLEFNTVIAAGINSSYMPFFLRKSKSDIEEERRLFYVASTRAIKLLIISTGSERASKFLSDINNNLYRMAFSVTDITKYMTLKKKAI